MSQADLEKWERLYHDADRVLGDPEPFIVNVARPLEPGRALDVAGGNGRHAVALAEQGWQVHLLDISPAGLALAKRDAAARGVTIETTAADLERDPLPAGPFDLVVVAWFLLTDTQWPAIVDLIAPGGSLIYVQPTVGNQARHAHPSRRFLVEEGELGRTAQAHGLQVMRQNIGWDRRDHHTERVWAQRPVAAVSPESDGR